MLIGEKAAAVAPLEELKGFLRIEDGTEDALLAGILRAATEAVEAWLGWLLIAREVTERTEIVQAAVLLRATPVQSLGSVALVDAGDTSPIADVRLQVSRFGVGKVALTGVCDGMQVIVRYRAGLADDWNGLPEPVRLGVLRAAAHFYAHRDGGEGGGLPPAVARLVSPWRVKRMR